jgi:hypothetical protein
MRSLLVVGLVGGVASAYPTISPELNLDLPKSGPAEVSQGFPRIAYDGTNYLVIFNDDRGPANGLYDYHVGGARMAPDGTLLDPEGFRITPDLGDNGVVGFDGTSYLVAYWGGLGHAITVGTDGSVGAPMDLPAGPSLSHGGYAIACDAPTATCLVVFHANDPDGATRVYGVRFVAGVPDAAPILLSTEATDAVWPAIADAGGTFLVVWSDYTAGEVLGGKRIGTGGNLLDASDLALDTLVNPDHVAIASDGTGWLVAWETYQTTGELDAALIGLDGTPVLQDIVVAGPSASVDPNDPPGISSSGAGYLVAWRDHRDVSGGYVYGTAVASDGTVAVPDGEILEKDATYTLQPALAPGMLVWEGNPAAGGATLVTRPRSTRRPSPPTRRSGRRRSSAPRPRRRRTRRRRRAARASLPSGRTRAASPIRTSTPRGSTGTATICASRRARPTAEGLVAARASPTLTATSSASPASITSASRPTAGAGPASGPPPPRWMAPRATTATRAPAITPSSTPGDRARRTRST